MLSKTVLYIAFISIEVCFVHGKAVPSFLPCPNGWITYEGSPSCYKVPHQPTNSWHEARKTCISMGSDLAVISSTKESNFVSMLIHTYFPHTSFGWIGFLADTKRNFFWVDGSPLKGNFLNWAKGEPNNAFVKNEDCGSIFVDKRNMKWNDLLCLWNRKIGYACEKQRASAKVAC
ncbi:asialoglycoprotein receptor 2 [Exaiptasia diaphana]|uniref:C-type lectin domain-containing protein n=1 Tax=Exaiptasia diaphana TaxID=2652724 RepID=A0A913YAV6_EXADI|nr:asialoglycoprotein receptor 2 [Exaiptasia diaphana]KXJ19220.1 Versican core protein [Exaiptasia diaphana]